MDQTLKSVVRILQEGSPELKIAATQVLGELRPTEPSVAKALSARLGSDPFLTPFVLEALARIGSRHAIEVLVSRLQMGGAVGERIAHLLGQMGSQVTKALAPVFDEGDAEMQARVLAILGRHKDKEAFAILRKALLHPDIGLSSKAADVLVGHLDELEERQREQLRTELEKALSAKSAASVAPDSLAQALPVLGRVGGERSRTTLLRFAAQKQPPVVRQAALRSLEGVPLTAAQTVTVLGYVEEEDMTHVARPAMQLLEGHHRWSTAAANKLQKMLDSESEERCLFALRALRDRRTEKMGAACLEILKSRGPEFREAAIDALGGNPAALEGLLKALHAERSVDGARMLAEPIARLGDHLSDKQLKALVEKTSKLLAEGDPLGDVWLGLLVEGAPEEAPKELVAKSLRLRRAKRLQESLTVLMRLAQNESLDDEGRYQLAVVRLLVDARNGRGTHRSNGDATMGHFATLVRNGFPLLERLKKESQLSPDHLLRVGRHFAEGVANEGRFGAELLQHIVTKHSRAKAGEEARTMLRAQGR